MKTSADETQSGSPTTQSGLADRLRDIAEEYLLIEAPLPELKSKLLHEAADRLDELEKLVRDANHAGCFAGKLKDRAQALLQKEG